MYSVESMTFFFWFLAADCKNWNSCGLQSPKQSFSLWTSEKKSPKTTRTISTTAKTSRKIYWPNIFAGVCVCLLFFFSSFIVAVVFCFTIELEVGKQINRCECGIFFMGLWTDCISWIIPMLCLKNNSFWPSTVSARNCSKRIKRLALTLCRFSPVGYNVEFVCVRSSWLAKMRKRKIKLHCIFRCDALPLHNHFITCIFQSVALFGKFQPCMKNAEDMLVQKME